MNAEQAQAILNSNGDVRDVQVCGDVVNGEKVSFNSVILSIIAGIYSMIAVFNSIIAVILEVQGGPKKRPITI